MILHVRYQPTAARRSASTADHRAASRVWVRRMKRQPIVIASSRFTGMAGERLEALRRMRRQPTTAAGPPWSVPRGAVFLVALLTMACQAATDVEERAGGVGAGGH